MHSLLENSWNIIGLLILIGLALFVAYTIVLRVHRRSRDWYRYFKTKNVLPAEGQLWQSASGTAYYVVSADTDGIQLNHMHPYRYMGGCSIGWTDNLERWNQIKKDRRIHLVGSWEK